MMKDTLYTALLVASLLLAMPAAGQKVGEAAHDFEAKTPTGETVRLSDFRGRIVLLDFWASWCGPCREELPFLIAWYEQHREAPFSILTINVDTEDADRVAFLDALGQPLPFTQIVDPAGDVAARYQLTGMPTTILVDAEGIVRFRHTGFRQKDRAKYEQALVALLETQ